MNIPSRGPGVSCCNHRSINIIFILHFYGCNLITRKPGTTRVPVQITDGYPGTKIPESPSTIENLSKVYELFMCVGDCTWRVDVVKECDDGAFRRKHSSTKVFSFKHNLLYCYLAELNLS